MNDKCDIYKNMVLLLDSGELDARDRRELEAHLARCGACREFQSELARAAGAARRTCGGDNPPARIEARILTAAVDHLAERRRRTPLVFTRRILAAAAALCIALGIWMLANRAPRSVPVRLAESEPEAQYEIGVENEIASLFDPEFDDLVSVELLSELDADDFTALDRELMLLEGLAI